MSYEERKYRNILNKDRFSYFNVVHLETDLWIGIGIDDGNCDFREQVLGDIITLRKEIESFIQKHQEFQTSLVPVSYKEEIPWAIKQLLIASDRAGTGPMAAIAGLFSYVIGKNLARYSNKSEVLVENGGDIYSYTHEELIISIYAGSSPLSNRVAIKLPPGEWGICTSSGTVGHSLSFGKADAVTIVSRSVPLADAVATQVANHVRSREDIEQALQETAKYKDIEGAVIILGDKIGITGNIEIVPLP